MKRVSKTEMAAIRQRAAAIIEQEPAPGFFLIGEAEALQICCWSPPSGLMLMLIEDDNLAAACVRHLLDRGAPTFRDDAQALEHARAQNWPISASST